MNANLAALVRLIARAAVEELVREEGVTEPEPTSDRPETDPPPPKGEAT